MPMGLAKVCTALKCCICRPRRALRNFVVSTASGISLKIRNEAGLTTGFRHIRLRMKSEVKRLFVGMLSRRFTLESLIVSWYAASTDTMVEVV